jgi:pimeloyl-CoA dehydrogenase small subunit
VNFDLDDDQRLLKDSVSRLLGAHYADFTRRRAYMQAPGGFERSIWNEYADAGILALTVPEQHGGLGAGPIETLIVMEEFGAALALEPYLSSSVLGAALLRHGGSAAQQASLFPAIADGSAIVALAQIERNSRYDLAAVRFAARRQGESYILDGEKFVVLGGGAATHLIVSARTSGEPGDARGITLFTLDASAASGNPGFSRRAYATQDGMQAADVTLRGYAVPASSIIGSVDAGLPVLERAQQDAIAAACAEAVGAMDALTKMTVEYLKTRKQFGVPIASFQALQHRAVDMQIMLEQARSMALYAALVLVEGDDAERRWAIAAAKVQVGRAARFIGQQATQLHGGIAMTMEYKAGHYFKRLTMLEQLFGNSDFHLRALAAL